MNEHEQLNHAMALGEPVTTAAAYAKGAGSIPISSAPVESGIHLEFRQWQIGPNDSFRPAGVTVETLPVGVYRFSQDPYGLYLQKVTVLTDSLIELPDSANHRVIEGMRKFWSEEDRYKKHGLLYKRGVLLWGPPGSGKTATLTLLSHELMRAGGLVVFCADPSLSSLGLAALRRIEPERRLICIIEDIDEIIPRYGEHDLLALLDGENQVDNIVMIATTNYPDRLGPRIVNRPSRFDERILVGMPSERAREAYLQKIAPNLNGDLAKWVKDTKDLSIAHLRELAAAVLCLDQPYDEVIERLRSMRVLPKDRDGSGLPASGFGGSR